MPIAVELTFDDDTAHRVRHLWDLIDKQHLRKHHPDQQSYPHLTLAVYDDSTQGTLTEIAKNFAAAHGAFGVSFSSLGIFTGREQTLFLAPRVDEHLLGIHRHWHSLSVDLPLSHHSHYSHDHWEPHVTLGIDLTQKQFTRAYHAIAEQPLPRHGTITNIKLVKFSPSKLLVDIPLGEQLVEITRN